MLKIVVSGSYTQNGNKDCFSCCFSLCFSQADKSYIFDCFTVAIYVFIGETVLSAVRVVRLVFFPGTFFCHIFSSICNNFTQNSECHFQKQSATFGITGDSSTML